ncbi:PIN domain-containing protein [Halorhabdus sp. BNX81]|uniref:PIN domain-containing protein n=1 Tax=Halorhabdus sp. BNX81 TaxID=2980181 RepID=UPI0023DD0662|nr:PIN domain-containing protein [Halorhabdus sp. BNX81]WEL21696.1 PIN domain containing protein [Halorhabdus sp. BNX81]
MKLVCDTNVVFSALIAGGKTRELILSDRTDLYAPEFFFTELDNHRAEIQEKSKLPGDDLDLLLAMLFEETDIVPREEFEPELQKARHHIAGADPDDVPFLALTLHLDVDVWSDDSDFEDQRAVTVWKTHDLVERFD